MVWEFTILAAIGSILFKSIRKEVNVDEPVIEPPNQKRIDLPSAVNNLNLQIRKEVSLLGPNGAGNLPPF